jgi:hypothetical protein
MAIRDGVGMKLFILCFLLIGSAVSDVGNFILDSEKTLYIVDGDSVRCL